MQTFLYKSNPRKNLVPRNTFKAERGRSFVRGCRLTSSKDLTPRASCICDPPFLQILKSPTAQDLLHVRENRRYFSLKLDCAIYISHNLVEKSPDNLRHSLDT
jgi:hypothetical protein